MTSPPELLQDRNWRLRNSAWMLGTIACCGFLTWASFLYVGMSAKRRPWLIASAAYGVAVVAAFVLTSAAPDVPDADIDSSSWQSTLGAVLLLGVWLGGFVHALAINRKWLRFRAESSNTPWYADDRSAVFPPPQVPSTPDAYGFGVDTDQYYGGAPPPPPPRPMATDTPLPAPPQRPPSRTLINVNTASLAEFLGSVGLDAETAERAIVERHRRGGFRSVEEFVEAIDLPPHIYARVRDVLTAAEGDTEADEKGGASGPDPEPGASGGRVLDL